MTSGPTADMTSDVTTGTPLAVLWDADGVLQHSPPGWWDRLVELGGADFPQAVLDAEAGPLVGAGTFRDAVAGVMADLRVAADVDDVLDLWRHLEVDADALGLVDTVRAAGTPCYLASNQQDLRVEIMRHGLGYGEHVDGEFYSSELGVMKPSPRYFTVVLEALGLRPHEVLFIDDNADNVAAASSVGLLAERHDPAAGVTGLREILARHGLGR